jgi:hypothetical protein
VKRTESHNFAYEIGIQVGIGILMLKIVSGIRYMENLLKQVRKK